MSDERVGLDPDEAEGGILAVFVECTECGTAVLTLLHFDEDGTPYANPVVCSYHVRI